VSIPVQTYSPRVGAAPSVPDTTSLTIRLEAEDQQAEGPQSFAVLDDGSFAVADPLKERLVIYSSAGIYQRALDLGAPISDVSAERGELRLTNATDGRERVMGADGAPAPARAERKPPPRAQVGLSADRSSGQIRWPGPAPSEAKGQPGPGSAEIAVQLGRPNQKLASLQVIAGSPGGPVYVAAESIEGAGQSLSTVGALVRRYSAAGELEVEVRGIPLDYYVTPTTPFRVTKDVLYQLVPKENVVLIHVWDLR
jgi:hypothetical protein